MKLVTLPINQIRPDSNQPRQSLNTERIQEISQSILTEGIINAIEIDENNVIVTGEMRWRAAKLAGLKEVQCKIIDVKPEERFRRQVIENIHHNTMTDWDTAKALEKLMRWVAATHPAMPHNEEREIGVRKLGKMIGKSPHYIRTYLQILGAPNYIRENVQKNKLSFSMVEELKRIPQKFHEEATKKVLSGEISRDKLREIARAIERTPTKAQEILQAKDIPNIQKISPPAHAIVKERLKPTTELIHLKTALIKWTKENPPDKIVHKDRFIALLNMSVIVDAFNEWGKVANQKQLK